MIGREAEVLAVQEGQSALGHRSLRCSFRDRHQAAGPLAVHTEVLGARGRDDGLGAAFGNQTGRGSVLFQTVTKALIGDVDHGNSANFVQLVHDGLELVQSQVRAGRVVAAAV